MADKLVSEIAVLLERLKSFSFPDGVAAVQCVRAIRTTQTGKIRGGPNAAWGRFKAEETTDATRSSFRWTAHMGATTVVDAYEQGAGWLALTLAGVLPLKKITGPEADRGELQRYLASVAICPPMLLNHPGLRWLETSDSVLRVSDRNGPNDAWVDLEVASDGHVREARAVRPRNAGKQFVLTPWSAIASCFEIIGHMRVPKRLEAAWQMPDQPFVYFRSELLTYEVVQ